ncbi:unnamed protein product [Ilex paraguariensis]|uniref:WRKY domain-containing protein n=1 Tax=Ilex paraguariensis TaxID=185542 RepID=A0ABC8QX78_9AQUA
MSVLITTYEGTHNHPLPVSATAMASTTSAAASMLRSASSSSQPGLGAMSNSATSIATNLHGNPQPFYFPRTSILTSQSHPTITLDLTTPTTSSHLSRLYSSFPSATRSSTLDFSSSSISSSSLGLHTSKTSWSSGFPSYGTLSSNKTSHNGISYLGNKFPQEPLYQPYMLKNNPQTHHLPETIAVATKVITSDPIFQSALAAAISSFVGNGNGNVGECVRENRNRGENSGQNVKWGESFPPTAAYPSTQNGIGCATSFLNRLPPSKSQPVSLSLFPASFPFSVAKSPSVSPAEKVEDTK